MSNAVTDVECVAVLNASMANDFIQATDAVQPLWTSGALLLSILRMQTEHCPHTTTTHNPLTLAQTVLT